MPSSATRATLAHPHGPFVLLGYAGVSEPAPRPTLCWCPSACTWWAQGGADRDGRVGHPTRFRSNGRSVIDPPRPRSRRAARAAAGYRTTLARWRQVELRLERRYPKLYDARHAAGGVGRALGPLLGPLLFALLVLPVLALLANLLPAMGLSTPSIDLPSVDLPQLPAPNITAPGWLQAVGDIIGAILSVLGLAAKYLVAVVVVILGVHRSREAHRRRTATGRVGRRSNEPAATGGGAGAVFDWEKEDHIGGDYRR